VARTGGVLPGCSSSPHSCGKELSEMIPALVRTEGEVNYHLDTDSRDASLLVPTGYLSILRISGGLWG